MTGADGFSLENVGLSYGPISCLAGISLDLAPGFFYGLIGPNGSGKSSLLDLMSGHLVPAEGSIRLHGKILSEYLRRELARLLAAVPQSFSLNFAYTVEQVVLMGRHPHIARFSAPGPEDFRRLEQALDTMAIAHLRDRAVMHLSGGEKQRVMLARALAQDTGYILLDEVTCSLDINHAVSIMNTLTALVQDQGRTIVAALHDLNLAAAYCDRIIVLRQGRLHRFGTAAEIISKQLIHDLYRLEAEVSRDSRGKNHIRFVYS